MTVFTPLRCEKRREWQGQPATGQKLKIDIVQSNGPHLPIAQPDPQRPSLVLRGSASRRSMRASVGKSTRTTSTSRIIRSECAREPDQIR